MLPVLRHLSTLPTEELRECFDIWKTLQARSVMDEVFLERVATELARREAK